MINFINLYKFLFVVSLVFWRKSLEFISLSRGICLFGVLGLIVFFIGVFGLTVFFIGVFRNWLCMIFLLFFNMLSYFFFCIFVEILIVCCFLGLGCLYIGFLLLIRGLGFFIGVDLNRVFFFGGDLEDFRLGFFFLVGSFGGSFGLFVKMFFSNCCVFFIFFCMFFFFVFFLLGILKVF